MRSRVFALWVFSLAVVAQGASALPLDITYAVSVEVAASSGLTPPSSANAEHGAAAARQVVRRRRKQPP